MTTQTQIGDVVVLTEAAANEASRNHSMWNDDLRPCTLAEHSWPALKFSSLWIGMCICLPTYSLAASMIALGMNWWESVLTILCGSAIVMIAILLVSHAGTKFGIPYPVFARLWFGTRGAHLPALARAVIAAGWFGINSWFAGQALDAILLRLVPAWPHFSWHLGVAFLIFWAINVVIAMRGPQAIGRLAQFSAPTLALGAIALFAWAVHAAGFGPLLAQPAKLHGPAFWSGFLPSVVGVIAFWATMALNIPDYTRYAVSQRAQVRGQIFAMPLTMALFSFAGIVVTSATVALFHTPLWNPVQLIVKFPTPVVVIAGIVIMISSITINVGANVMAPARAFENLWPRKITFAWGAVITGLLSLAMEPWYLLSSFTTYIFVWLGAYGAMLGAFDGIAIADYWLVRKRRLDLAQLYAPRGIYAYARGLNPFAIAALAIGWALAVAGAVLFTVHAPSAGGLDGFFARLSSGGWLLSLGGGLIAYALLMQGSRSRISHQAYTEITGESASPADPQWAASATQTT
ncbi:MAG: NCS1 family nucleobase:cation symporter-1 [Candidatus Tyrphobacter sp.]